MRASRLISIVLLLQARGRITAQELADTLEVSVRTIYRDMDSLNAAGIPVVGEAGNDGGYELLDGYRTKLTGLTPDEAQSLFLAGVPAAASAVGLDEAANATRLKLLAAIPATAREHAERASQRVHVDIEPWDPVDESAPLLPRLHQAIWDQTEVRLAYGTGRKPVTVAPLGLVCKGGKWYLVAERGARFRTYRVSRIHHLTVTADRFERPPGFGLVEHWRHACEAYVGTFCRTTVRLRLRGAALLRVTWAQVRAKTVAEPGPDGWADAELELEDEDHALTTIRMLGDEVIVVEPEKLRQKAVEIARGFVAANDADTRIDARAGPGADPARAAPADR